MNKILFVFIILILAFTACQSSINGVSPTNTQSAPPVEDPLVTSISTTLTASPTSTQTVLDTQTPAPTQANQLTPTATMTRVSEPTATPTEIPSATATPLPQIQIAVNSANVRSGPGTAYNIIDTLYMDDIVLVTAANSNQNWFLIALTSSNYGWIAADVIKPAQRESMVAIPVAATIPALPSPLPVTVTATALPTPAFSETGTVTLINNTDNHPLSLKFYDCCKQYDISTQPGETAVEIFPANDYRIQVYSNSCNRSLPNIKLGTEVLEVTVIVVPVEGRRCTFGLIVNGEHFSLPDESDFN